MEQSHSLPSRFVFVVNVYYPSALQLPDSTVMGFQWQWADFYAGANIKLLNKLLLLPCHLELEQNNLQGFIGLAFHAKPYSL